MPIFILFHLIHKPDMNTFIPQKDLLCRLVFCFLFASPFTLLQAQGYLQMQSLNIGDIYTSERYEQDRFGSRTVYVFSRVERITSIKGKMYSQVNSVGWVKPPFNPNLPDTNFVVERTALWVRSDSLNVIMLNAQDSSETILSSIDSNYLKQHFSMVECTRDTIWGIVSQNCKYMSIVLGNCAAYRYQSASPFGNISTEILCNSGIRPTTKLTGAILSGRKYGSPLLLPAYISITGKREDIEIPLQKTIKLYPNPSSNRVVLRYAMGAASHLITIQLLNIMGEKVKVVQLHDYSFGIHDIELDVSDIRSGMYILQIITKDGVDTQKLLVSH